MLNTSFISFKFSFYTVLKKGFKISFFLIFNSFIREKNIHLEISKTLKSFKSNFTQKNWLKKYLVEFEKTGCSSLESNPGYAILGGKALELHMKFLIKR